MAAEDPPLPPLPPLVRPPERIERPGLVLRRWNGADADALDEAVLDSFAALHAWMPWATLPPRPGERLEVLRAADDDWDAGRSFNYVLLPLDGAGDGREDGGSHILGCAGMHHRGASDSLEIGYWIRTGDTGRGLATMAARALTDTALALDGVDRAEIHCDVANGASAAIPRRLGYRLERRYPHPPSAPAETGTRLCFVRRTPLG